MAIRRRDVEVGDLDSPRVMMDVRLLAKLDNDIDKFYDIAPYSTASVILTMPTEEEGGRMADSKLDDLRTIRCHIEARCRDVIGVIKGNNTERLTVLHSTNGIILTVEYAGKAGDIPRIYRAVGAEAIVDMLGTKVDALE